MRACISGVPHARLTSAAHMERPPNSSSELGIVMPGQTTLSRMPWRPTSRARLLVRAITPALQAPYTASRNSPMRPASEPMLTMAPLLRVIMPSRTARVQLIMPQRLSCTSFSHSARSFSTKSRSSVQPTLLTSTSTRPVRASTSRTVPCTESHFVTSVGATATEAAPAFRASTAVFSPWPASISAMVTCVPSRAKASEIARPMFDPPPVTMTLLPFRFRSIRWALAVVDVGGATASPCRRLAAVEIDGLPGEEVRRRRGHVDGQGGCFRGLADAPRGNLGEEAFARLRIGHGRRRDVRVHVAGGEAVDLDAVARPLCGKASRQSFHRGLARAVGGVARHAENAVHGAHVDDLAALALDHAGRHCSRAAEHGGEVGHEHLVPLLVGNLHRWLVERHPCVVDEDVDGAQRALRLGHGSADPLGARHVQRNGPCSAARCLDLCRSRRDLLLRASGAGDRGARFSQCQGDGTAEAAAGPGDERGAAFEGEETLRSVVPLTLPSSPWGERERRRRGRPRAGGAGTSGSCRSGSWGTRTRARGARETCGARVADLPDRW